MNFKIFRVLALLFLGSCVLCANDDEVVDADEEWSQFKSIYNKEYLSPFDNMERYDVWLRNKAKILLHNKEFDEGKQTYKKAVNEFTDISLNDLLDQSYFGLRIPANFVNRDDQTPVLRRHLLSKLPVTVDWRSLGLVSPVKRQGACGASWAFSTIGAAEAHISKKLNVKLNPLSVQNMIDCSINNYGCDGGWITTAFDYMKDGLALETENPFRGKEKECEKKKFIKETVKSYSQVKRRDEYDLARTVGLLGPVAVALHVNDNFLSYESGVFEDQSCLDKDVNHAVLVVGYGTDPTLGDYWIAKNSWGPSWGENGFVKIARNRNHSCNLAAYAYYPIV